jgi:hypothetical protein
VRVPQLREALFAPADGRGNAPHATREAADVEGRRLNAMRYETVQQAEQALDPRTRRSLGAVDPAPQQGGGVIGTLVLGALALGAAWALFGGKGRVDGDGDEDGDEDGFNVDTVSPPAPAPVTLNVTVSSASAPPKVEVLPNPPPAPVVVEAPKRRRRKPKALAPVVEAPKPPET